MQNNKNMSPESSQQDSVSVLCTNNSENEVSVILSQKS